MAAKNPYWSTAISLYINYIVVGISAIAFTLNIEPLMEQMNTNRAGIGFVVGGIGIGKFVVLLVSGILSDKFGRKPFIQLGALAYILAFTGILFAPNVTVGITLAFLAGCANSFMDAGTYPALMESFPKAQGTANILIKAACSFGSLLFPFVVSFILVKKFYFGYSFLLLVAILVVNAIVMHRVIFPPLSSKSEDAVRDVTVFKGKPNFWLEGIFLICIGFTCSITFDTIAKWVPTYAQDIIGMGVGTSGALISYYSIGSLISVFVTAALVKRTIRPAQVVFAYPLVSLFALLMLYMIPSTTVAVIAAFLIGFFAAGGVLQLTITTMSELFPQGKGKAVGFINTMNSVAFFAGPAICGALAESNAANVILFDVIVTAVGVVLGLVVFLRYRKVVDIKATKEQLKAVS